MKSPRKLMTAFSVMAFTLLLPACSESRMRANQEEAEVPAGTQLYVRVNQNATIDNQKGWKSGDEFQGTLARSLQVNGRVIAPEGTIVKGELTDKLDRDTAATTTPDTADTRARDSQLGAQTNADRSPTGDATMSAGRADRDRMGLELNKIVLNGEEYKIDTHTVPVPGMMSNEAYDNSTAGKDRNGNRVENRHKMDDNDKEAMAKSHIAGQEFVFTLEDKVDLPATTNMKTE